MAGGGGQSGDCYGMDAVSVEVEVACGCGYRSQGTEFWGCIYIHVVGSIDWEYRSSPGFIHKWTVLCT